MAYTRTTWRTGETPLSASNFNNIEDGIEEAMGLFDTFWQTLYPVGCYFETSDISFNPATAWGGTWELETAGQVHVSAGTGYTVHGANTNTSDGGNKNAIVPYHNHTFTGSALGNHSHTFTGSKLGNHSHTFTGNAVSGHTHSGPSHSHGGVVTGLELIPGGRSTGAGKSVMNVTTGNTGAAGTGATGSAGAHTPSGSISSVSAGTPSGTISSASAGTPSGTISYSGTNGNTNNANMQPYIVVNRWHRTA